MRSLTFMVATNSSVGCNILKIDSAVFVRNSNFFNLKNLNENFDVCDLT